MYTQDLAVTAEKTFNYVVPLMETQRQNQIQTEDEGFDVRQLQPETIDEHLDLLNRVHLKINHIPQLMLKGTLHTSLLISIKVYYNTLAQIMQHCDLQQRIQKMIILTQTYQELVKQYGLFLVNSEHIRGNIDSDLVIWINQNFCLNFPDFPLKNSKESQQKICKQLTNVFTPFFNQNYFKNVKFDNLSQLQLYLMKIQRRNQMLQGYSTKTRQNLVATNKNMLALSAAKQQPMNNLGRSRAVPSFIKQKQCKKLLSSFSTKNITQNIFLNKENRNSSALRCSRLFDSALRRSLNVLSQQSKQIKDRTQDSKFLLWSSETQQSLKNCNQFAFGLKGRPHMKQKKNIQQNNTL